MPPPLPAVITPPSVELIQAHDTEGSYVKPTRLVGAVVTQWLRQPALLAIAAGTAEAAPRVIVPVPAALPGPM